MEWKNEFLRLYTSEDIGDFKKALELKRKNLPQKIYRYRPVSNGNMEHRLSEIADGTLYLSHPNELNDPFEIRSILHSTKAGDFLCAKEIYQQRFAASMTPEEYKRVFDAENYLEELAEYVSIKTVPPEHINETKKFILKMYMDGIERFNTHIDESFRRLIRLACFTTKSDNLPMWSHYASAHKGICLEYDTARIQGSFYINSLHPVIYVKQLPNMTYMMARKESPRFSTPEYQAMHKLKDWEYEDEWRLILDVGSFYPNAEAVPEEFWSSGHPVYFQTPSKIILGKDIDGTHEAEICFAAASVDIPVCKAEMSAYGLKFQ